MDTAGAISVYIYEAMGTGRVEGGGIERPHDRGVAETRIEDAGGWRFLAFLARRRPPGCSAQKTFKLIPAGLLQ